MQRAARRSCSGLWRGQATLVWPLSFSRDTVDDGLRIRKFALARWRNFEAPELEPLVQRFAVAAARPMTGDEPDFVVEEPFAGPWDGGVGDVHGRAPLFGQVQAQAIAGEYVGESFRGGM